MIRKTISTILDFGFIASAVIGLILSLLVLMVTPIFQIIGGIGGIFIILVFSFSFALLFGFPTSYLYLSEVDSVTKRVAVNCLDKTLQITIFYMFLLAIYFVVTIMIGSSIILVDIIQGYIPSNPSEGYINQVSIISSVVSMPFFLAIYPVFQFSEQIAFNKNLDSILEKITGVKSILFSSYQYVLDNKFDVFKFTLLRYMITASIFLIPLLLFVSGARGYNIQLRTAVQYVRIILLFSFMSAYIFNIAFPFVYWNEKNNSTN